MGRAAGPTGRRRALQGCALSRFGPRMARTRFAPPLRMLAAHAFRSLTHPVIDPYIRLFSQFPAEPLPFSASSSADTSFRISFSRPIKGSCFSGSFTGGIVGL